MYDTYYTYLGVFRWWSSRSMTLLVGVLVHSRQSSDETKSCTNHYGLRPDSFLLLAKKGTTRIDLLAPCPPQPEK